MNPVVDTELDDIAGHLNAQHARLVRTAHLVVEDSNCWTMPGILTPEQFLCWRTGISRATATRVVTIARRSHQLTHCMNVFDRGELSLDQMSSIANKLPAWADHDMAELAPKLTVRQLQRTLANYVFPDIDQHDTPAPVADDSIDDASTELSDEPFGPPVPDGHRPPSPCPVVEVGGCRMWFDDNGRFHLHLDTDKATGLVIEHAINEARDHLYLTGQHDVTNLDAILEVAQRSLDAIDSPDRRNRWRINLHLRTDGRCTDECGQFLPDTINRYLTCDGLLTPTLLINAIPVSVGRSQHIVPDRTRRLVIARDGGCGTPGCDITHHLEVHHIIHWNNDGPTDTWNLIALCPHHHRMHHQGRLGITGNADIPGGVTFTNADGNLITASGIKPKPPGGPPPPITGRYRHPLGERLDMNWINFPPPDHHHHRHNRNPVTTANP